MPLAELSQPTPPQTPKKPQFLGFLIFAVLGLAIGTAAEELRWRSSVTNPNGQMALAKKDAKIGDYSAAITIFDDLAKRGNPLAQYWVAHMNELGLGVTRDPAKAIEFYKKAAAQDTTAADLRLGEIYLHGNLVLPDFAQAKSYLEKAAYHGEPRAAMLLGQIYHDGIGVTADPVEAYAWSEVATLEGSVFAERDRNTSLRGLNDVDQEAADARAHEILKNIKSETSPVKPPLAK